MQTDWNQIFIDLTNRANNADEEAMKILHDHYINEKYELLDFNENLVKFYKEGSKENKPYSLFHLGIMYCFGKGVDENLETTAELFKQSIEAGCSQAYVFMATLVQYHGIKYNMNFQQLINKGMEMNNSNAYVYEAIRISKLNIKKSIKLLKKAIKLENTYAIFKLGELYHDNKKYKKAIKYYDLAINKNIHHASFNLAIMYMFGEGIPVDKMRALELFSKSHELGNDVAIISVGKINQDLGNIDKAKECYQMAIDRDGDGIAYYNMGILCQNENNHKEAIKNFISSAKTGYVKSKQILIYDYSVMKLDMTDDEIDDLLQLHNVIKNFGAYDGFMV